MWRPAPLPSAAPPDERVGRRRRFSHSGPASSPQCRRHRHSAAASPAAAGAAPSMRPPRRAAPGGRGPGGALATRGLFWGCGCGGGGRCGARRPLVAARAGLLSDLGMDSLTFLATVVLVVPLCRSLRLSPTLGFLLGGLALDSLGLLRNEENVASLSELGVLFLLFEQGLELSFARLKALAKFAFGLGLLQVVASTAAFTAFELPVGNALGTQILTTFLGAQPDLVDIRSLDEAVVIGAGLALSSSAFVLQVLQERGELATPYGRATLGVLLMQDIAVVPILVVLPLYESAASGGSLPLAAAAAAGGGSVLAALLPGAAKALLGLGALLVGGRVVLRRAFEVVAGARSTEAFVALCLLTVTGTSLLTQRLGFSDTLGAFLAGVLLAETNYRSQVELEIKPFRGLLLGLFFVTTGTSIDVALLWREWPEVLGLVAGLIAVKSAIVAAAGPLVGLTRAESVRTGLLVGQGGEFAFVVFSLANTLGILPNELNHLLIIVVVASMALTPALAQAGAAAYDAIERWEAAAAAAAAAAALPAAAAAGGDGTQQQQLLLQPTGAESAAPAGSASLDGCVVLCGFGPRSQAVMTLLRARQEWGDGGAAATAAAQQPPQQPQQPPAAASASAQLCPLPENAAGEGGAACGCGPPVVAFDLDPRRAAAARAAGFAVVAADASVPGAVRAAGVARPSAALVAYAAHGRAVAAVGALRDAYGPSLPIVARCAAGGASRAAELRSAGATRVVCDPLESAVLLAGGLLAEMGRRNNVGGGDDGGAADADNVDVEAAAGGAAEAALRPLAGHASLLATPPELARLLADVAAAAAEAAAAAARRPQRALPPPGGGGDAAAAAAAAAAAGDADGMEPLYAPLPPEAGGAEGAAAAGDGGAGVAAR